LILILSDIPNSFLASLFQKAGRSIPVLAMSRKAKIVVIGDGTVGKTCLLWSYAKHEVPLDYVPTVFDNLVVKVQVKNEEVSLQLWDTAGQEELENIRALSYTNTDVFMVCFSLVDPPTLANIPLKWLPELRKYLHDPRVILVGTKRDLRDNFVTPERELQERQRPIDSAEGRAKSKEIKAAGYVECSAMRQEGVQEAFDLALKVAMRRRKRSGCLVL
jgi:small GTP-binding protein